MAIKIEFHGTPKSKYDGTIRSMVSQHINYDSSYGLGSLQRIIQEDIAMIRRTNAYAASATYPVKLFNQFESNERIEIWNEVMPGKERKIITITK